MLKTDPRLRLTIGETHVEQLLQLEGVDALVLVGHLHEDALVLTEALRRVLRLHDRRAHQLRQGVVQLHPHRLPRQHAEDEHGFLKGRGMLQNLSFSTKLTILSLVQQFATLNMVIQEESTPKKKIFNMCY